MAIILDGTLGATLPVPLVTSSGGSGGLVGGVEPIQPITASVGASALTVTLNPTTLNFRSTTLNDGTINTRTVATAISLTVPAGAAYSLGTVSGQQSRLVLLALDNAGTVELAIVNIAGGVNLDETTLITTTAIGGGNNSASIASSTAARTSLPFRVVGYVESTQATAGTWATAPSTIQGQGGQALAAMSSLGYGQTWQAVTRTSGTTYYNTTGKPIVFNISAITSTNNVTGAAQISIAGNVVILATTGGGAVSQINLAGSMVIPAGAAYTPTYSNLINISTNELR